MNNTEITSLLITKLNLTEAYVTGDNNHIKIIVVGDLFRGISPVKRQQMVYIPLTNMIKEKRIHAVSIFPYTCEEWKKNKKNSDTFVN